MNGRNKIFIVRKFGIFVSSCKALTINIHFFSKEGKKSFKKNIGSPYVGGLCKQNRLAYLVNIIAIISKFSDIVLI